jgi:hypothetical protein
MLGSNSNIDNAIMDTVAVLPVLTPRFLQHPHDPEELQMEQQQQQDSTHLYLTDRWPNIPQDPGNPLGTFHSCSPTFHQYQQMQEQQNPPPLPDSMPPHYVTPLRSTSAAATAAVNPVCSFATPPATASFFSTSSAAAMWISPQSAKTLHEQLQPHQPCLNSISPVPSLMIPASLSPNRPPPTASSFSSSSIMTGPPSIILVRVFRNYDSEDYDDEVSVLADNPDDDDVDVLPHSTYDVLANIFDQIYKDDSIVAGECDDDYEEQTHPE